MEKKHRDMLSQHRTQFVRNVEVERIIPYLKTDSLTALEVIQVTSQVTPSARVEALLDILPNKGSKAFHTLCLALESTYPHLLTAMFLGAGQKMTSSGGISSISGQSLKMSKPNDLHGAGGGLRSDHLEEDRHNLTKLRDEGSVSSHGSSRSHGRPISYHENDNKHNNMSMLKTELKLVCSDRDIIRDELQKVRHQLGSYQQRAGSMNGEDMKASDKSRDYEWLKSQCDQAMNELMSLKLQHGETVKKCDHARKEADTHRLQYKHTKEKLDGVAAELHLQKTRYHESMAESQRLEHELLHLQKQRDQERAEMLELRQHQQAVLGERGTKDVINQMYESLVVKYEAAKQDLNDMRREYSEATKSCNIMKSKVDLVEEEKERLRVQYDEVSGERNSLLKERKSLQQHCTEVIQESIQDCSRLKSQLQVARQERDDYQRKVTEVAAENIKTIGQLKRERDAVVQEYTLVMSERDSVHKEMEQLQDKLTEAQNRRELHKREKIVIDSAADSRRKQAEEACQERDRALKQLSELKEKHEELERKNKRNSYHTRTCSNCNSTHDELVKSSIDRYGRQSQDNTDGKESDGLRKEVERLQAELSDALREVDVAKGRRDWAFTERDKIVRERESIRTLCDKMRHERDNAISKLAEAIRDSEELTKQKNDTTRELKEFKEKYDAMLEKEARKSQLNSVGQNHSRDSAIDTDLQEWEIETLNIELGGVDPENLGFELVGGKDDPQFPNDPSIFISMIRQDSPAYGKLKVNDNVKKINGIDLSNADKQIAYQALYSTVVNVIVRRRKLASTRAILPVHINLGNERGAYLGVSIEQGFYVSRILPGSAAAKEGSLAVGDRILHVNGQSIENLGSTGSVDVLRMIQEHADNVTLNVLKYCGTPQGSLVSSSSASSGHNLTESSPECNPISPKSNGNLHMWRGTTPSPDTAKNRLKSSGSRTDSLDSGGRPDSRSRDRSADKINFFNKPIHKIKRFLERHERDARCKSEHPFMTSLNSGDSTDEAIDELDAVIKECETRGVHDAQRRRRRGDRHNGGTWPKCTPHTDIVTQQIFTATKEKERPRLPALFANTNCFVPQQMSSPTHDNKLPPTPPERKDSFERGASMRHSPQTSDSSVKYPHLPLTVPAKPKTYTSSPNDKSTHSHHSSSSSSSVSKNIKVTCDPGIRSSSCATSSPIHYSASSTPESSTTSPDYSVVSANIHESEYVKPKPTVAKLTHRQRDNKRSSRDCGPCKPTTLDVKSQYSPRPIPHTGGQIISQSHPVVSPGSHKAPLPSSHSTVSTPQQTLISPSDKSSLAVVSSIRSSEKPPVPPSYNKTHHNFNPSSNAAGHVMRSSNPVVHLANSHVISSASVPYYPQPISTPPRYSSPPVPYSTRYSTHSSTQDDPPPAYQAHMDGYSTPSPSLSRQVCTSSSLDSSSNLDQSMTTSTSEDFPYPRPTAAFSGQNGSYDNGLQDGSSTFPSSNRRHQSGGYNNERICIPSTPNVVSSSKSSVGKISFSSEGMSDRGSPVFPILPQEFTHLPPRSTNSLPAGTSGGHRRKRPVVGQIRNIKVEKSKEPLGITIKSGRDGGIFVCTVGVNSLAYQAGIEIGDQILEVCGINMRNARYKEAASVLRQCGGSINMLVQFNPHKCQDFQTSCSEDSDSSDIQSPELHRRTNTLTPDSTPHTLTPSHSAKPSDEAYGICEPRFVMLKKQHPQELGVQIVGGNVVGIFVRSVNANSVAAGSNGLRCGDQILEFNGLNFREATAERAVLEMNKPADTVTILAQYNVAKFNKIQDQPCDSFYARAQFDRQAENEGELSFKQDDVLLVDNTLYEGKLGQWRAWLVDYQANKYQYGTVPSKCRLEDEFALKRSSSETGEDDLKSSRRGSASARRSFFKRKRHQRNNSKDSRDFHSFSDASINSDSLAFLDDGTAMTFERVERLDCNMCRPVLILGPLAEPILSKLTSESPDKYCCPEIGYIRATLSSLEKGQNDGVFIDFKPHSNGKFACVTLESVKEIVDKKRHCLLNVNPTAIDCLHKEHIYPIVLFIKHKSPKQLREVKDTRFLPEKLSNKVAKELHETFQEYESKYKRYFSDIIAGGNLAFMCYKIKAAIDKEQQKTVWVPSGSL